MNRAEDVGAGAISMQFDAISTSTDHVEDVSVSVANISNPAPSPLP
jgi:hypothetical protein